MVGKTVGIHKILERPSREDINDELPLRLRWVLERGLAKEPRARYQHAVDLAVELRNLRAEVESGTAASLSGAMPAIAAGARRDTEPGGASTLRGEYR